MKKQFNCLGENTEKYIIFSVPIEKEFIRKTVKLNPTYYNLLIAQDLWEAHYQILLITLLKKFIELNVNINMIMKNVEHVELNTKIASAFLNT